MRAVVVHRPGPPDVLRLEEVPDPVPTSGELLVRVHAAGVQPADAAVRVGWAPPGSTAAFPVTPGNEFAGVVEAIGPDVHGFREGDEVLGYRVLECYAERVAVPAGQVVAKPRSMPWVIAGALSASGQTAHTAIEELEIRSDETLLVHAAAGGVGTVAVQIARLRGATVIGTASRENHEYLRDLGAIPTTYGPGLVERVRALAPRGVDAALNGADADALLASLELVNDRNRIGTITTFELVDSLGVRPIRSRRSPERLADLVRSWTEGQLRIHVRRTFPLEEAAAAHAEIESRHGAGKVVLLMTREPTEHA